MDDKFQQYFKEIWGKYLTGDYTEFTYRTPLENFIKSLNNNFDLIQGPKTIKKIGSPDFKAFRKKIKIGFIETKDLNNNLNNEIDSEQIKKYKESINNILLTNYVHFILIKNNQKIFDLELFKLSDLKNSKFIISNEKIDKFLKMIETFFDYSLPTIKTAKELAYELSKRAKLLKELAKEQLEEDLQNTKKNEEVSSVYDSYEGFKELIKDVKIDDCADAYAQTITYSLFLSKIGSTDGLERNNALLYIPKSISIIKRIFMNISGDSLPSNLSWIIDEIVDILNASNIKEIISEFEFEGRKIKDPFIDFYEYFLLQYDPIKRKHLGIFYTPRPVVSFITKSINEVLKKDFGKPMGFVDESVTVLDPAVGTGTFLANAFLLALVELKSSGLKGLINKKIENHLLKNFYGFEILVPPYVISHLKLTLLLKKWFYEFKDKGRVQVYLTNTLDPTEIEHSMRPFSREITKESEIANMIKREKPILVVMGNPPYSVSSSNKSYFIQKLMGDYKKDLKERNIQPLDDDYIKFIRFAQWKIEQNKSGILGFITNNSYLNGIIHRKMREELLNTFDRIYILNLHGDSRKKETSPNGGKDENVFDIQQGVAISLFIKNDKFNDKKIFYADLYGKREEKYLWLYKNNINSIKWKELELKEPYYFFVEKDFLYEDEYRNGFKIDEIFDIYTSGVKTHADEELVSFNKFTTEFNRKYLYRVMDFRFINYDIKKVIRHRFSVMKNMLSNNLALITTRLLSTSDFRHAFVTEEIGDIGAISNKPSETSYYFPLYISKEFSKDSNKKELKPTNQKNLLGGIVKQGRQPNFKEEFLILLSKRYPSKNITPEEILGYIYAILYSKKYREKYQEFLKIDFPRIPFVNDYNIFKKLSELGSELIELHLMKKIIKSNIKFDIGGSNIVEFIKYKNNKIYINKNQFFNGVPKEIWNFYIGGYQVLDKWLKSRKNRELSSQEIELFIHIVEVLKETIKIMNKIDQIKFIKNDK